MRSSWLVISPERTNSRIALYRRRLMECENYNNLIVKIIDPCRAPHAYLCACMNNYSAATAVAVHSDFLSLSHMRRQEFQGILGLSADFRSRNVFGQVLQGKSVALIFEKPSLRTRVTFEVGIRQLGGWPIVLGTAESGLGEREPIQELAGNVSCWVDGVVARVFNHHDLEDLALFESVPVVYGLSDAGHSCAGGSELLTLSVVW